VTWAVRGRREHLADVRARLVRVQRLCRRRHARRDRHAVAVTRLDDATVERRTQHELGAGELDLPCRLRVQDRAGADDDVLAPEVLDERRERVEGVVVPHRHLHRRHAPSVQRVPRRLDDVRVDAAKHRDDTAFSHPRHCLVHVERSTRRRHKPTHDGDVREPGPSPATVGRVRS
jgi:hypothetical protein